MWLETPIDILYLNWESLKGEIKDQSRFINIAYVPRG